MTPPCRCGTAAVCWLPEPLCRACAIGYYRALVHIGADLARARVHRERVESAANRLLPCTRCVTGLRHTGHGLLCVGCLAVARHGAGLAGPAAKRRRQAARA